MEFISKIVKALTVPPNPQRYVSNYDEYTEDLKEAPDMTSIVGCRDLGYGGCKLVVTDGSNPDRLSYVYVPKTSPFAKFLEAYDYAMACSERNSFGSAGHVRGYLRVPTTPAQVCMVSEIQDIYVESSLYRSGMAYAEGGDPVDFVGHSLREDEETPYYDAPSKDKQSDLEEEEEEEEEDIESGRKGGKRKDAKKHKDVVDEGVTTLAPDLASYVAKSNGISVEISMPVSLTTENIKEEDGVVEEEGGMNVEQRQISYDDNQYVTRDDYIQYILSTIGKRSLLEDDEGLTYEKLEECAQDFSRRVTWDTHVEASQKEFELFHAFVCLSLGDTLFLNTLRRWMDRKRLADRTPYHSVTRGKDPVCDGVNPLVDLRKFLDDNFMSQKNKEAMSEEGDEYEEGQRQQEEEEEEENGHACLVTGRRMKEIDNSFGMAMFEKYVELIVEEGERLMPVNSAVIAQMLAVCTGVLDMWQEISAQHRPPGMASTMPAELRIPTGKIQMLAELSKEVNEILSGTSERIV